MNKVMDEAHSALSQAANDMARFYDAHRERNHCMKSETGCGSMAKHHNDLTNEEIGPYSVEKVILQSAYKLKLPLSFG